MLEAGPAALARFLHALEAAEKTWPRPPALRKEIWSAFSDAVAVALAEGTGGSGERASRHSRAELDGEEALQRLEGIVKMLRSLRSGRITPEDPPPGDDVDDR